MIHVKSHRRGRSVVKAYNKSWGGKHNPGRLEELQRTLDHSMATRRTLTGRRKGQIDRTIGRLQNIFEMQRASALRHAAGLPGRVKLARAAGDRARKIQAYRTIALGRRG
jgi:hypothetical protein